MSISEMLLKSNPVPAKREMSMSEYNKLVDANTKLIDEIKVLTRKYNIMKENAETLAKIIDKAIEYMNDTIDFSWKNNSPIKNGKSLNLNKLLDILQGVDKE